ncbi:hypothetical protein JCM11641_007027 [Rhodosporidiobolus odoratus]
MICLGEQSQLQSAPANHPSDLVPPHRPPTSTRSDDDSDDDFDDTFGARPAFEIESANRDERKKEKKPHFFPPLWLARRTRIVEELKKEDIRTVADLGCGSGALLSLLALPAYHADDFPPSTTYTRSTPAPSLYSCVDTTTRAEKLAVLSSIPPPSPSEKELHPRRLIGVDIDRTACTVAAAACKPYPGAGAQLDDGGVSNETRWEEIKVEVFEGGVETFNQAIEGVEAVVMTEVIEHITPAALARLPSLLFSVYQPRLVIFTTPAHEFNPYFPSPSSSSCTPSRSANLAEESHLHLDPTGSTSRVFRDPTHLREWTSTEFRSWADQVHEEHASSYTLEYTGVGSLASYYSTVSSSYDDPQIPFPPPSMHLHPALNDHPAGLSPVQNPKEFFATQIAIFRRKEKNTANLPNGGHPTEEEEERSPRSPRPTPLPFFTGTMPASPPPSSPGLPAPASASRSPSQPKTHSLVSSFTLCAHPSPTPTPTYPEILDGLPPLFLQQRRNLLSLSEIWRLGTGSCSIRELSDGRVQRVVEALVEGDEEGEWEFSLVVEGEGEGRREKRGMDALGVRWVRYVEPEAEEADAVGWEEGSEREDRSEEEEGEQDREEERGEIGALLEALQGTALNEQERTAEAGWESVEPSEWSRVEKGQASGQKAALASGGVWADDPW